MYSIYVSNKSGVNVFVRLHRQQISDLNGNFHRELDQLTARAEDPRGNTDSTQSKPKVSSFLARWGFCMIPKGATTPFAVEDTIDTTRMYASLYSSRRLWLIDYEVLSVKYGCVDVMSHKQNPRSTHAWPLASRKLFAQDPVPVYFRQTNPEPHWIKRKKGDCVKSENLIRTGRGNGCFGRLSFDHAPCRVTYIRQDEEREMDTWEAFDGRKEQLGELLMDTGHEFFRAKIGDRMPPHAVTVGVNDNGELKYLGRIGDGIPCSVTAEDDKVGYFDYFSGEQKQAERGEIMVLTGRRLQKNP